MELLERYLQAVESYLPARGAAEILQELRENIVSQMEEREEQLGRTLTAEEEEEIVRQHGAPMAAAANYGPRRHLIGPAWFPFYWRALQLSLLAAVTARAVVLLITIALGGKAAGSAWQAVAGLPLILLAVFAGITVAFAGLEWALTRYPMKTLRKWEPAKLPRLRENRRRVPRVESAAGLLFGIAGAVWWQLWPAAPFLILGPAALFLEPAAVWDEYHRPVLFMIVFRALLCAADLLQPRSPAVRQWIEAGFRAAQIILLALILRMGPWVSAAQKAPDHALAKRAAEITNQVLLYVLAGLLVMTAVGLARRLYRNTRWAAASFGSSFA